MTLPGPKHEVTFTGEMTFVGPEFADFVDRARRGLRVREKRIGAHVWLRVYDGGRLVAHLVADAADFDRDPDAVTWLGIDDPRRPE